MLAETLEEKLAAEKTLATVVESNNKIRQTYEPMITSPEERALYEQWGKLWADYKKGTEEVMALSRKAAGQIPQEAHELNTQDGQQDRARSGRNPEEGHRPQQSRAPTRRPRTRPTAIARPS